MRFWTTDLSYNDFFNRLEFSRRFGPGSNNKGRGKKAVDTPPYGLPFAVAVVVLLLFF
jgi:hypothetical protein